MTNLKDLKINDIPFLDLVYPIGSIHETSDGDFNPAEEFGGTWEKTEGRFLIGASDEYPNGTTGGSKQSSHYHELPFGIDDFSDHSTVYLTSTTEGNNFSRIRSNVSASINNTFPVMSSSSVRVQGSDYANVSHIPPYKAVFIWNRIS